MKLNFVRHPLYHEAHPREPDMPNVPCERCAIAEDPKTHMQYLLWQSNGVHWALSRHDPHFNTKLRVSNIELIGG